MDLIGYKFIFDTNLNSDKEVKFNTFKIVFKSENNSQKKIELIERELSKEELELRAKKLISLEKDKAREKQNNERLVIFKTKYLLFIFFYLNIQNDQPIYWRFRIS